MIGKLARGAQKRLLETSLPLVASSTIQDAWCAKRALKRWQKPSTKNKVASIAKSATSMRLLRNVQCARTQLKARLSCLTKKCTARNVSALLRMLPPHRFQQSQKVTMEWHHLHQDPPPPLRLTGAKLCGQKRPLRLNVKKSAISISMVLLSPSQIRTMLA